MKSSVISPCRDLGSPDLKSLDGGATVLIVNIVNNRTILNRPDNLLIVRIDGEMIAFNTNEAPEWRDLDAPCQRRPSLPRRTLLPTGGKKAQGRNE